jgi:hypothetical protein
MIVFCGKKTFFCFSSQRYKKHIFPQGFIGYFKKSIFKISIFKNKATTIFFSQTGRNSCG